jgi:uncharacterized protein (DUF58 family)
MLSLRRFIYRFYRLVSGARYRAQRRFTRAGLAVLGGAGVAGLLSADVSANAAYQGLGLLVFLLLGALSWTWFFRGRFTARRLLPRFGTVGTPLTYRVTVRNETRRSERGLCLLENLVDPRPDFEKFVAMQKAQEKRMRSFSIARVAPQWSFEVARVKEATVPALEPGQAADIQLELTPLRRGLVRFTGLTVARPDPLGLVKAHRRLPLAQSLLVLPRRYPLSPVALPGSMKYQQGGVALASSVGASEEFVALRDYRHGDPWRHIHWRSWARAGRPIVKEFEDEFFVRHALILDTFSDHPHGEIFEEAVSVAASFACTVQTQESLLDLLFVGAEAYCFTSGRGLAHTDQMLEILAAVEVCRAKSWEALERLVLGHVGVVSGCICVLLAWDDKRRQLIRRLKMLGVPTMVLVIKERGGAALEAGPLQDEPERFHVLETGAIAEGLARL